MRSFWRTARAEQDPMLLNGLALTQHRRLRLQGRRRRTEPTPGRWWEFVGRDGRLGLSPRTARSVTGKYHACDPGVPARAWPDPAVSLGLKRSKADKITHRGLTTIWSIKPSLRAKGALALNAHGAEVDRCETRVDVVVRSHVHGKP